MYPTRHLQNTQAHAYTHTQLKCHATQGAHHKTSLSQY